MFAIEYIRDICKTCGKKLIKAKHVIEGDGDYCIDTDCYKQSPVWIEGQKIEKRICERCGNEFEIKKCTGNKMCMDCLRKAMDIYEKHMATLFTDTENDGS